MMIRIKRYKNRKLYDLRTSRYVNMAQILMMLRSGNDIRVDDMGVGQDVTGYVLAEALSMEMRSNPNPKSLAALKDFIRAVDPIKLHNEDNHGQEETGENETESDDSSEI